jgi:hypothetical protein
MRLFLTALSTIAFTTPVHAYIGPGAGLGAIGTAIALIGALILLIVGFVWYPIKRLIRRRKSLPPPDEGNER